MPGNLVKFLSIFWACATVSSLAQTEHSFVDPNGFARQHFGFSVDINDAGTRCVVGYFDTDLTEGPADTIWKVFVWDFVSNNWTLTTTLEEAFFTAQPQAGNAFGESVAISGDGNRIVVGGSHHDGGSPLTTKQGKVWVFEFNGVSWSAMAELQATGTLYDARFGQSVDINGDGTIIAAGAPREWHWDPNDDTKTNFNRGAVYVFRHNGTSWVSEQRIIPLDWNCKDYSSLNPRPLQGNPWTIPLLFGLSVDIDPDGDALAVGAPHWDVPDPTDTQWSCPDDPQQADLNHYNYGAVYTFKYQAGSWNQTAKFWHDSGVYPSSLNVFFGRHVVVEDNLLVAQSPTIDRTWFFQENPITQVWSLVHEPVTSEKTRHSKSIDIRRTTGADWVVLGASKFTNPEGSESGKLFLYKKPTGGVWAENATFLPSAQPLVAGDHFASAVAISFVNGRIVASAPDKQVGTNVEQGRVYVIHNLGN